MRLYLAFLLIAWANAFYMKNLNEEESTFDDFQITKAEKLRSNTNSIEMFGQRVELPTWMNTAAEKTRGMFDSATHLFGKGTATSRKSSEGLMTNLKKDEATRIWFAVYLNILVVVLIYVFITIKLALLSLSEGQMERKKRNTYSSHVAFESPDYNLPLTTIATRKPRAMSIDNPASDFEIAREAREDEVVPDVTPLDYDAIPSTECDDRSF
ncbi:hypothetical protein CAEBREN_11997 [Caenorhabditis brenneri]|uniref:Uncharacterized protein n=1 Tax=Caenorhabditis brenneri TaxID=135651 RepID=G0N5S9_CAEBE|nr:hypothetical protein CAEBREN_11997 [Caenorhabditis brenneri]